MIRQLPVSPSRDRPAQFSAEMDALLAALPGFVADANALEGTLQLVATTGTSTSTVTVGNGSKSLVTQPGKAWIVGAVLYVVDPSAPANIMQGQLTAYNTATGALTINVQTFAGSGSRSTWVIGLAGVNVGAASTGANTFTGAQTLPGNAANPLEAVPLQQLPKVLSLRMVDSVAWAFGAGAATILFDATYRNDGPFWNQSTKAVSTPSGSFGSVQCSFMAARGGAGSGIYTFTLEVAGVIRDQFVIQLASGGDPTCVRLAYTGALGGSVSVRVNSASSLTVHGSSTGFTQTNFGMVVFS
jgi:hypothetical protein